MGRDAESATHKVADLGHKLFAAPKPHVHPRIMQPSCLTDKNTNYVLKQLKADAHCGTEQEKGKNAAIAIPPTLEPP